MGIRKLYGIFKKRIFDLPFSLAPQKP